MDGRKDIMVHRNICVLKTRESKKEKKQQLSVRLRKIMDERIKIFEVNILL